MSTKKTTTIKAPRTRITSIMGTGTKKASMPQHYMANATKRSSKKK